MRNPNGFGTIRKLSGKRKKPYAAMITTGYEMRKPKDISFLEEVLGEELFAEVQTKYQEYFKSLPLKATQQQKAIGYYETKQEALIALSDYHKKPYDLNAKAITFKDIYDHLYKTEISQMKTQSAAIYKTAFKKSAALHDMKIEDIKTYHLQAVMDEQTDNTKGTNTKFKHLYNMVFKYALSNDLVNKNYAEGLKLVGKETESEKQIYTEEEIEQLWNNIGIEEVDTILMAIYTGTRINELLALRVEDIDLKSRIIDLKGTKNKNAKRLVPIHKRVIPLFENRIANAVNEELFTYPQWKAKKYITFIRRYLTAINEQLGQAHTIHETRHTFISTWKHQRLNASILKKIVGHAGGDITEDVYTHYIGQTLVEEIDKLVI